MLIIRYTLLTVPPQKFAQELEKERADASVETRTLPPPRYKYAPKKHTHYASKDPSPLKTVQLLAEDPTTHKKASRRGVKSKVSNSCSGRAERKPSSHRGSKYAITIRNFAKIEVLILDIDSSASLAGQLSLPNIARQKNVPGRNLRSICLNILSEMMKIFSRDKWKPEYVFCV